MQRVYLDTNWQGRHPPVPARLTTSDHPLKDYAYNETRYSSLADTDVKTAVDLLEAT